MQSRSSNVQRSTHPRVRGRLSSASGVCALLSPRTLAHTATATAVAVELAYAFARDARVVFCPGKHAGNPLVQPPPCRLGSPERRQRRLLGAP